MPSEQPGADAVTDQQSTLGERILALLQYPLPHRLLSDIVRLATRSRVRWFKNALIGWVHKRFNVDLAEAQCSALEQFESFNAFFTRALKEGARPLANGHLLSPVDGCISEIGRIEEDRIFQAKGHDYRLLELLAGDQQAAEAFRDGHFATIYLSPRDYHRVHMPWAGTLQRTAHVPGRLFSVAPFTVRNVPRLFARNERLICHFDSSLGPFAVILVGALLVSSMSTVWAGDLRRARRGVVREKFADQTVCLAGGDEMGRFNMGSTVILLFPNQRVAWQQDLRPGTPVRMGMPLADIVSADQNTPDPGQ